MATLLSPISPPPPPDTDSYALADIEVPSLSDILTTSSSSHTTLPNTTFTDPLNQTYLSHLTTLPLPELQSEPTTLSSSSAQLTNALTTLCHSSYPTFLSLHSTTQTLNSSIHSLTSSLDGFLQALPAFEDDARKFASEAREIQRERRKANLVLESSEKLSSILTLPTLLDSFTRSYSYNEALLLSSHASSLANKFPNNPLIQSVKGEVEVKMRDMVNGLMASLSEREKLNVLFRNVGFLRKMEVFKDVTEGSSEEAEGEADSELALALAFLNGRNVWIESVLNAVEVELKGNIGSKDKDKEKEVYVRFLKKYVDAWREGVYDVVTQFTTIFLDYRPSTTNSSAPSSNLPPSSSPDLHPRLHTLLTTFASHHIQNLLTRLSATLPKIPDPSLLTSLLTQLSYCANSFARIGLDFRGLLSPIFTQSVKRGVEIEVENATKTFCETLFPPFQIQPAPTTSTGGSRFGRRGTKTDTTISGKKLPSHVFISSTSTSSSSHSSPTTTISIPHISSSTLKSLPTSPPNVPPQILASFPPLAIYTNSLLTCLNSLRMLAPTDLLSTILAIFDSHIAKAEKELLRYSTSKPWRSDGQESEIKKEEEVVKALVDVYFKVFVRFIRRAVVEGVYGVKLDDFEGGGMNQDLFEVVGEWEEGEKSGKSVTSS
ncbi:Dor1-like family-domain-containing protein [Abortiporus biennis]|nr:Dor1-like family-domain-containing protein [Abortiporus biennis]